MESNPMTEEEIIKTIRAWYQEGREQYDNPDLENAAHNTLRGSMQSMGWVFQDVKSCLETAKIELRKHGVLIVEGRIMTIKEYERIIG